MKPVQPPRRALEIELFQSLAHMHEVELGQAPQHAQGLQLVLSPRIEQEKQHFQSSAHIQEVELISPHQHAQGLQLILSPRYAQEKQVFPSSMYTEEVQLTPSAQHTQGLQLVVSPRHEKEKQHFQSSAHIQEVELISPHQHSQGLQLILSPRYAQEKQVFPSSMYTEEVQLTPSSQHTQGLQLVVSPRCEQEKPHFHSSAHIQEVEVTSSQQHAQGLQLVLSPRHSPEKQTVFLSSMYTQEVQLIPPPQHAQGQQLVSSPRHDQEKQHFQSSAHIQEVELIPELVSPHQHPQGLQLVLSPRHAPEKQVFLPSMYTQSGIQEVQLIPPLQHAQGQKLVLSPRHEQEKQHFQSSAQMQEVQLISRHQHEQGLQFVLSPRHSQEKQLFQSSTYTGMQEVQLIASPQYAQGLQLLQSPRHVQEKEIFQRSEPRSEHMQEAELIPSPQYPQGTQLLDWPAHMHEKQLVQTTAELQEIRPPEAATHVKEITEYLIAHELWHVPDSVLYEEPISETQCDLETFLDDINDATDGAEEFQEINTLNAEDVEVKSRKRGGRRHKGHFMKRPMALSEVIEELKNNDLRENALRCLSGHLVERREQDPDFYRQAGFYIFHSCSTLVILIQEILFVYEKYYEDDLNIRRSKRMANVLCLLQCVATNDETRLPFLKAQIPNYLIPFILSEYTEEVYENLRALSLSVISILCQTLQKEVIEWALQNDVIEVCFYALDVGSELSKVLAMTILDSILRVDEGLSAICEPSCGLLPRFIKLCEDLVSVLAYIQGFSPRLLFLVVRSFILLCQNCRALELLKDQMPTQLQDTTFRDVKIEYPLFAYLRHLLLLCTGKSDYLPSVDRSPTTPASLSGASKNSGSGKTRTESVRVYVTPMRPVNLNKQDWSSSARLTLQT